jgi:hypothetical protein
MIILIIFVCYRDLRNMSINTFELAEKCLRELGRTPYTDGLYRQLQISFSDNFRIYVCCSSLFVNSYIVHQEYDHPRNSDKTKVWKLQKIIDFLENFDEIVYVGFYTDEDTNEEVYRKENGLIY